MAAILSRPQFVNKHCFHSQTCMYSPPYPQDGVVCSPAANMTVLWDHDKHYSHSQSYMYSPSDPQGGIASQLSTWLHSGTDWDDEVSEQRHNRLVSSSWWTRPVGEQFELSTHTWWWAHIYTYQHDKQLNWVGTSAITSSHRFVFTFKIPPRLCLKLLNVYLLFVHSPCQILVFKCVDAATLWKTQ